VKGKDAVADYVEAHLLGECLSEGWRRRKLLVQAKLRWLRDGGAGAAQRGRSIDALVRLRIAAVVVVAEHRSHLVKRSILVVKGCICVSLPKFAKKPLPRFASAILVVLAILVCLFQKQDADGKAKYDETSANKVREKKRVLVEDGIPENGHYVGRTSEQTAKGAADDGATKKRSARTNARG